MNMCLLFCFCKFFADLKIKNLYLSGPPAEILRVAEEIAANLEPLFVTKNGNLTSLDHTFQCLH